MRSATNNRFLNVWQYQPGILNSACEMGHSVWTLAEVAAMMRRGGSGSSIGTYSWPVPPTHAADGPSASDPGSQDECAPEHQDNNQIFYVDCGGFPTLCGQVIQESGCSDILFLRPSSLQWERSTNGGLTWFRLPDTAADLMSTRITIGSAIETTDTVLQIHTPEDDEEPPVEITLDKVQQQTQFYGVIDSIRISRGIARYVNQICTPYNPAAAESQLIDDYVIFALNVGDDIKRRTGGTEIRYYVKNRGWLFAPNIRQLRRNSSTLKNEVIIDTTEKPDQPIVLPTRTKPVEFTEKPTDVYALGRSQKIMLTWRPPNFEYDVTKVRMPVVAATTENITLVGEKTIDDAAVIAGNRVLVKNQTDRTKNGVYRVVAQTADPQTGNPIGGNWYRDPNEDESSELLGAIFDVQNGTVNGGKKFVNTNTETEITFGDTDITFNLLHQIIGHKIEYKAFGVDVPSVIDTFEIGISATSNIFTLQAMQVGDFVLPPLQNNIQYSVRVSAITNGAATQEDTPIPVYHPFSVWVLCTPRSNIINLFEEHHCLTYTNKQTGYMGRCGIQFPLFAGEPGLSQFLLIDDYLLPRNPSNPRTIVVTCATTTNLETDINGDIWGKTRVIDSVTAAIGKTVLVKDQYDPLQNGIYLVRDPQGNQGRPWIRVLNTNGEYDNLYQASVVANYGLKNIGRVWKSLTPNNLVFGETAVLFEQDKLLGLYDEDFCVEAYFKPCYFRHPGLHDKGLNITLLDLYHRCDARDAGDTDGFSGLRIYFSAELSGKQGYVFVDVGRYDRKTTENPDDQDDGSDTGAEDSLMGPALRSKLLDANRFYHVAVTRESDTFRLYIDGVLQDQLTAQEPSFAPFNLTAEQNHYLYRVRPYFYRNDYGATKTAQILVRRSEFFHISEGLSDLYAIRFNGAAGMLTNYDQVLLNMPLDGVAPEFADMAWWPGQPIPDYPAPAHVYIVNDYMTIGKAAKFLFKPRLRFPIDTLEADLATVPENTTYYDYANVQRTIAQTGSLSLFGLTNIGAAAVGAIVISLSSSATFNISQTTLFSALGVSFSPLRNYTAVLRTVSASQPLLPNELIIQRDNIAATTLFTVVVPVVATTRTANGNVAKDTVFTPSTSFANVLSMKAQAAFRGGVNPTFLPLEVDGIAVSAGMRILAQHQNVPSQNGVYIAAEGAWQRADDMNSSAEIKNGTRVFIKGGYTNSGEAFVLETVPPTPDNRIVLGTTNFEFEKEEIQSGAEDVEFNVVIQQSAVVGKTVKNDEGKLDFSVVVDDPVFAVKAATTQNVNLYGLPSPSATDGVTVDVNQTVLVKNQTDKRQNGVYTVSAAAWRRVPELSLSSRFVDNLWISPRQGNSVPVRRHIQGVLSSFSFSGDIEDPDDPITNPTDAKIVNLANVTGLEVGMLLVKQTGTGAFGESPVAGFAAADAAAIKSIDGPNQITITSQTANTVGTISFGVTTLTNIVTETAESIGNVVNRGFRLIKEYGTGDFGGTTEVIYILSLDTLQITYHDDSVDGDIVFYVNGATEDKDPIAYRMHIPANFELNVDNIEFDAQPTELRKMYLPFAWRSAPNTTTDIKINNTTKVPYVTSGTIIKFEDILPDKAGDSSVISNDKIVWRLRYQCGKTIGYSRAVILRFASKVGIKSVKSSAGPPFIQVT